MTRKHDVPWRAAGTSSEAKSSADDVVRSTGWVFNNVTGRDLTLAEFVETGEQEVGAYLPAFGIDSGERLAMLEIGSGIGRMTAAFTHRFGRVVACDLDAAFLERCRETVAQFGVPARLSTVPVSDGRTLGVPDDSVDMVFSYITFQHCHTDDALELSREAVRVTAPGGQVALNYRTWVGGDALLWPAGKVVRALWRIPGVGGLLARRRISTRLGWQANRVAPAEVVAALGDSVTGVQIFRSPQRRPFGIASTTDTEFDGVNRSHWWLIARVA